ncbi:lipopolysaccharide biosynthesis protein [Cobetia marina]|uniref:lipopolysaccharide biosynthesis protein n=1 Tax=Cobetia marina TaxID=28258 RepID=UPI0010ADF12C|nr:oligosaccharide flippase family protein [Cobetia marina]TKD62628.1 lipopolysaccharide biosynthesis protein [Cobetia marina]
MINKAKAILKSRFVRNVAIVAGGTAGAQAISLVFSPIITRLYDPEAFGVLSTFIAMLAILKPITAFSFPIAIVLPAKDDEAYSLSRLSIEIAIITTIITCLFLFFGKHILVDVFNLQSISEFLFIIPIAMFGSVMLDLANQWIIRKKLFTINAKVAIVNSLSINIAKVGFGLYYPLAIMLIVIAVVGNAINALLLYAGASLTSTNKISHSFMSVKRCTKFLVIKYQDFVYFRTPQMVLNAASQSMPVLILGSFFGPAAAGSYALGRMVLAIPTTLIGQSVSSVFYPRINEAVQNGENAHKLLFKATITLALIGIVPFGIIMAFGPYLFEFIFGEKWYVSGVYVQWLALWSYFGFINRPSIGAIPVLRLQGVYLIYEVTSVAIRALSLYVGYMYFDSALISIMLFSIASALLNVILVLVTLGFSHNYTVRLNRE